MALTGSADFESADAGEDKTVTYNAVGLTGSKAANYELTAFTAETTASITAMPIAFTVGAATFAYSGFVSGEDERVLWQAPMTTCSAIPTSPAGDYDIVLTGDFAENYDIELVNGKLTVTADTTGTLSIEGGRAKAKVGDSFTVTAAYSGGKFGPEDSITREQMALILYNYAGYKDYDRTGEASLTEYNDNGRVSDWAREAMIWAVSQGLISGTGGSMLDPAGSATRAEAAQSLTNFWQKIVP